MLRLLRLWRLVAGDRQLIVFDVIGSLGRLLDAGRVAEYMLWRRRRDRTPCTEKPVPRARADTAGRSF